MAHIDVIENDWAAEVQRRVATLFIQDGEIRLRSDEADVWRERLLRPIRLADGQVIDPFLTPEEFLKVLPQELQGTYLFALGPHPEEACPIPQSVLPMAPRAFS